MKPMRTTASSLIRGIYKAFRSLARNALHGATSLAPVEKHRIVFSSLGGVGYCDSPKYLYGHIRKHYPNYQCIWAVSDTGSEIPGSPIKVTFGSASHVWYLRTSEYWISRGRTPIGFRKRLSTLHLQTWYGTPLIGIRH